MYWTAWKSKHCKYIETQKVLVTPCIRDSNSPIEFPSDLVWSEKFNLIWIRGKSIWHWIYLHNQSSIQKRIGIGPLKNLKLRRTPTPTLLQLRLRFRLYLTLTRLDIRLLIRTWAIFLIWIFELHIKNKNRLNVKFK